MNSSEEMLEALISNARIRSRPILRSPTDSDSDSEDSKVVDLETVWAKLGLGKGKKHGLIEEANWYKKSLVDKTEAKPKPKGDGEAEAKAEPKAEATSTAKAEGDGEDDDTVFASAPVEVASASATPTAKADDKGKKEAGDDDDESMELDLFGKGGASLLDAIQYEQNRLNSVNQMIGGKYY